MGIIFTVPTKYWMFQKLPNNKSKHASRSSWEDVGFFCFIYKNSCPSRLYSEKKSQLQIKPQLNNTSVKYSYQLMQIFIQLWFKINSAGDKLTTTFIHAAKIHWGPPSAHTNAMTHLQSLTYFKHKTIFAQEKKKSSLLNPTCWNPHRGQNCDIAEFEFIPFGT